MRIYELAKELNIQTLTLIDKAKSWGLSIKSHMSSLTEDEVVLIKQRISENGNFKSVEKPAKTKVVRRKTAKPPESAKKKVTVVRRSKDVAPIKPVESNNITPSEASESSVQKAKVISKANVAPPKRVASEKFQSAPPKRIDFENAKKQSSKVVSQEELKPVSSKKEVQISRTPQAKSWGKLI